MRVNPLVVEFGCVAAEQRMGSTIVYHFWIYRAIGKKAEGRGENIER
jgi:hypothetical protein